MEIIAGGLDDPRVVALLEAHLARARAESPLCSVHALDVAALEAPGISFWTGWEAGVPLVTGALKALAADHGEIKSMHTAEAARGRGLGAAMLRHLVAEARARGYRRLSLETGSQDYFAPARALYRRAGFAECGPFAGYRPDPNSVFMTLDPGSP